MRAAADTVGGTEVQQRGPLAGLLNAQSNVQVSKTKIKKKVDKFGSDTDRVGITGATTSLNHLRDWGEASARESYQPGIKKSSASGLIDFP